MRPMVQEKIEQYLRKAHFLSTRINKTASARKDILQLIETYRDESKGNLPLEEFFQGEFQFYSGNYETALKHYLQASAIPNYAFFCYRSSAAYFQSLGNLDKALGFAKKALKLFPNDYLTLSFLEKLLGEDNQHEDAVEVRGRLKALEKEAEADQEQSLVPLRQKGLAIGEEEIRELAHIFEEHRGEDELFAEEFSPKADPQTARESHQNHPVTSMETPMNTESDIFSSPKSQESGNTRALTERLYTRQSEQQDKDPYTGRSSGQGLSAFEELKKLASGLTGQDKDLANRFLVTTGHISDSGNALEKKIKAFQLSQAELTGNYLQQSKSRVKNPDYSLYYLNGWQYHATQASNPYHAPFVLAEQSRKANGGYFIRWNGKGIVINPGHHFLENFHEQGLHIRDIDFVIVTGDQLESYADVKEIYELNYQLNKVSQELQIIQYYFNHKAFQDLSRVLKPHFKQERHTLHSLEIFLDSPDVEKIELSEGIVLNYFQATNRESYMHAQDSKDDRASKSQTALGIRLELKTTALHSQDKASVKIGYAGQAPWNPLLAHHLGNVDVLIAGFGNTSSNDYNKISYNQDSLGYYGTYTLLEEISPRLLLCGEFSGREGDIRIETVQKIRDEYYSQSGRPQRHLPVVLPGDTGLFICLKSLKVKCSVSDEWVDPAQIRVVKTASAFGRLEYLAPACFY